MFVGLIVATGAFAQGSASSGRLQPLDGNPTEPLDPARRSALLKELRDAGSRFQRVGQDYREEIRSVVTAEVNQRTKLLNEGYGKQITQIQQIEQRRRRDAIAAFRQFVERYPNHSTHTPDAMFRLAELYYEESELEYGRAEDDHDRLIELYERGKLPDEPPQPELTFAETIKLYRELVRRFKDYRYRGVAMYLLGYCLERSGDDTEAKRIWEQMATAYPQSKYAPEVWLRIGEYYFDGGEWVQARKAYAKAAEYTDSSLFDLALYKLAWTYFQDYNYDAAIRGFKRLIGYYDKTAETAEGSERGRELRNEAVQYLARSLAEDDWDGDGEADEGAGVERALRYLNEGLPFEREVMEGYAKALVELHEDAKYREAIKVYRTLIDREPNNPQNPEFFETLIELYYTVRDKENGLLARQQFVENFGRKSNWYKANIGNPAVTSKADELVEAFLKERALMQYELAVELRKQALVEADAKKLERSIAESSKAASIIQQYLSDPRHRKDRYALRYYLAEMYYKSEQYLKSAIEYESVRDDETPTATEIPEYADIREDAAFSAIAAVEKYLEEQVKKKRMPKKALALDADVPPEEEEKKRSTRIRRVKPQKLPKKIDQWVASSDRYVDLKLERPAGKDKDYPVKQSYRIGLMFYNFRHYDEARRRWELVIKGWPNKKEASFAARNVINSYKEENDWVNVEKWADRVAKEGIGRPEDVASLRAQIKLYKLGVSFDKAEALYAEKKYVEAAEEFERVVGSDPKSKFADKALFNAGQAYQLAKHWNSAARVFEQIVTEPRFAGSQFRQDALVNLAENHRRFFAFDKAIHRYQALVKEFPTVKEAAYALFKSAQLLEMTGRWAEAAQVYERYSNEYNMRDDAMLALFRTGLVYEKMKDVNAQIRLFRTFIKRFSTTPGSDARIVEANMRLGDLFQRKKDWKTAKRYYEQTIKDFQARGLAPGDQAEHAAKAQFELVDASYRTYHRIRVTEGMSLSRQQKTVGRKFKLMVELANEDTGLFMQVARYQYNPMSVAAYVRMGQVPLSFAKMLYDAPDPPGIDEESLELYREQIEEVAVQREDFAVEKLQEAVAAARRLKIVNDYSQLALTILNGYKPKEYPLLKAEKRTFDFDEGLNSPLVVPKVVPPPPVLDAKEQPGVDDDSDASTPSEPEPVDDEKVGPSSPDPAPPAEEETPSTAPEPTEEVPAPNEEVPAPDEEVPAPDEEVPAPDGEEEGP
jgi:TolA-binding protein